MAEVTNEDMARTLDQVADLLELTDASPFRVRAHREAARSIEGQPRSVAERVAAGEDPADLPSVGEDIARKVREIAETGHLAYLEELKGRVPGDLPDLLRVPGLGPKRVRKLYDALGVASLAGLREAAEEGRIRRLPGFGARTEGRLLEEARRMQGPERRFRLDVAEAEAAPLAEHLRGARGLSFVAVAGSFRRFRETVGDLDLVAVCAGETDVMDRLAGYEDVERVIAKGPTRATVRLASGIHVDLRVVSPESGGAALLYFTGSKAHNIALRRRALDRGLKLNEYGLFRGDARVAGAREEDVYAELDLPYVEPELRENQGEIEAAEEEHLPRLVTREDLRGDLQAHTTASDGAATLEEMAEAARARGLEYLAITDHAGIVPIPRKLDEAGLRAQGEEIDRLNERWDDFTLLKGVEVDILSDGRLGLPDRVLEDLDLVVASVHTHFEKPEPTQTERVLAAVRNPLVSLLGHPTARLVQEREPIRLDLDAVLEAAAETGCVVEVNGQPKRLDLHGVQARRAKELGVKLAVSTDAHTAEQLDNLRYGAGQARRGWLEPDDVVNTRRLRDLEQLLDRP